MIRADLGRKSILQFDFYGASHEYLTAKNTNAWTQMLLLIFHMCQAAVIRAEII